MKAPVPYPLKTGDIEKTRFLKSAFGLPVRLNQSTYFAGEISGLSGHLFLFSNRAHTRLKALVWDGSGLWVCAKRLERGSFHWPKPQPGTRSVTMRAEELAMLVNGMDLTAARPRENWYRRAASQKDAA